MEITITPAKLIELAKANSGLALGQMAKELHVDATRISKLKKGECALSPSEGIYFADKAGLPPFETIAELEIARNPDLAPVWERALAHIRKL